MAKPVRNTLSSNTFSPGNLYNDAKERSITSEESGQTTAQPQTHLWQLALAKLRTEDNSLVDDFAELLQLELDVSDGSNWISQISSTVSTRVERLKTRQWHYKWRGKPKKIRDQFQRVLQILTAVNGLMSTAANVDPLHIGLPLAGISVILNVSENDPSMC